MNTTKTWYTSKAMIGAILALVLAIANSFGFELPIGVTTEQLTEYALWAVAALTGYGRLTATTQLTATK